MNSSFQQFPNPLHLSSPNLLLPSQAHEQIPEVSKHRRTIASEELKIEKEIMGAITTGRLETLKPNSGEAIPIGEHYVCVSFHEENDSDYRVWEWHGHVVSYNAENGYSQDYVYGNYFERIKNDVFDDDIDEEGEEEPDEILGLKGLIGGLNLTDGRIFCRNLNASTNRFL